MRVLGFTALAAVCVQGLLGGITVLYFLPTSVSTAHAGLAQIFFCLTVSIALFTSRGWTEQGRISSMTGCSVWSRADNRGDLSPGDRRRHDAALGRRIGDPGFPAGLRRTISAGVDAADRDSLRASGRRADCHAPSRRPSDSVVSPFAARQSFAGPRSLLACLVLAQVTLGAFVIWSQKNVAINTAHVVVGALTLATSLVLTLRSHQVRFTTPRPPPCACATQSVPTWAGRGPRVKKATLASCALIHQLSTSHRLADFLALTKPRLNSLVVVTAAVGYYLGAGGDCIWRSLFKRSSASHWSQAVPRASIRCTSETPTA